MTLGEKLVLLRKELGLSQLEAAEKLNVSRQAISRWEVGAAMPSVDNLKYLSELYGVPVDVLLDDGQDLPAWREGQRRREPEHTAEPRPRGRRWVAAIAAAALVVGIAVGVFVGLSVSPVQEEQDEAPLEELQQDEIELDDEMQFSIGW